MNAEFGTVYLFFKMQNSPWTNPEFRNALIEAIPYDTLRKEYTIQAESLVNPLPGYPKVTGIADWDASDAAEMMKGAKLIKKNKSTTFLYLFFMQLTP